MFSTRICQNKEADSVYTLSDLSSRINGMATSAEPKSLTRSVLVTSTGQPLVVHQPLVQEEYGMVPLSSPFLTQASLFYTPTFFAPQQLAMTHHSTLHQFAQVSSLLPLHNTLSRENYSSTQNGCGEREGPLFKSDNLSSTTGSDCTKSKSAASVLVGNETENGREPIPVYSSSLALSPSLSPGTPKSPLTPGTPHQTPPSPVSDEICVICSDKATGHHYGVTSCEGCKGFFKRSVQNKKVYSCRNLTQDCPVDKRHRNRCQFCRFQKCVKAGMLKEGRCFNYIIYRLGIFYFLLM